MNTNTSRRNHTSVPSDGKMIRVFSSMYSTFVASLHSIGTAVTLASVGVYLHHNNLISNEGKRTLALLSQQITFPLYLFTKILYCNQDWSDSPCPDITASLQDVWMLAFWPLYVVGSGMCFVRRKLVIVLH